MDDFQYSGVDIDYDIERHCDEHGCHEDGICRCSTIENTRVEKINIYDIYNSIIHRGSRQRVELNFEFDDQFINYCIYRLLITNKVYNESNWEINTCGGYYGEEILRIYFCDTEKVSKQIDTLYNVSTQDRIRRILEMEYGFILDSLKGKKFVEKEIDTKDIIVGNDTYRKKIDVGLYSNYPKDLPIGIYLKQNDKYRLIDGYHRYVDLVEGKKLKTVKIISAE